MHLHDAHAHVTAEEDEDDNDDDDLERTMGIARGTDVDAALLSSAVVLHENRPVAIMEQLYELFCYCHIRAGHGGRDKTCAVIRQHYSWVPKELTAQFVKACPTCALKRSGGGEQGVVQRRTSGGRERKGKGTTVVRGGARERIPVGPSSLGWPTTGGPLDLDNPLPCGMRERERPHRMHEHAEPIGSESSSLVSPARDPRISSPSKEVFLGSCPSSGWNDMPRAPIAYGDMPPTSPFRLYDPTHGYTCQTFLVDATHTGSPSQTGDSLPSLATALSNESLDDNFNLTGLSEGGECLPPALRPLRLSGPVAATTTGPGLSESEDVADLFQYQIDPALLSFGHAQSGFASSETDEPGPALSGAVSRRCGEHPHHPHHDLRLRATSIASALVVPGMPALDTSDSTTASSGSDSPDSRFERTSATSTFTSGMSFTSPCRSPPRYCGYDGSPGLAAMFLPMSYSTDDPTLSRFSILTDA